MTRACTVKRIQKRIKHYRSPHIVRFRNPGILNRFVLSTSSAYGDRLTIILTHATVPIIFGDWRGSGGMKKADDDGVYIPSRLLWRRFLIGLTNRGVGSRSGNIAAVVLLRQRVSPSTINRFGILNFNRSCVPLCFCTRQCSAPPTRQWPGASYWRSSIASYCTAHIPGTYVAALIVKRCRVCEGPRVALNVSLFVNIIGIIQGFYTNESFLRDVLSYFFLTSQFWNYF